MRRLNTTHTGQRGDTIIEVMLAIAVLSMVLAASYNIANRALMTGRYAQEQTEAVKQAESQLEKLKYKASLVKSGDSVAGTIFDTASGSTTFCIGDDSSLSKITSTNSSYDSVCKGRSGLYALDVNYNATSKTFIVTASWDSPIVNNANVKVAYKLYQ
ncbi:prepilin-type N-terminal cleavage/methylation domain-containing protein [bacterium]|nr:prepilin-type N-terminal cleavage/methylation domain-containing protein [bacterium]NBX97468.1 prepilin-type N-terminal cleavage/methylation domain-containing protein [bacterium]NDC95371.1 prepilin-type N-terminal cleavage/methylation domain-containing protein [bacterium]NDD83845.1 prepilin-type N-terminal cleavage/methylation domain-containing protein [bacterium]NDG31576.1 prepilin-type N-terminal cleavage/methylation domain-containing protein [bacterium]